MVTRYIINRTYAERLFGQVDVRDLSQLAAEDGDSAVVGDGLCDAGEGLHEIGEASGGKHLSLEVLIAGVLIATAKRQGGGQGCVLVLLVGLSAVLVVALVGSAARSAEDADEGADELVDGEAACERVLCADGEQL